MQDKQSSVMDSSEHLSKSPVTSLQNITDLPSTLPLPNTSLSVNDTGKSDIPAPPLVTRGSAPSGTFCIPEEGLRVSLTRSFLSRFQTVISPPVEPTIKKDLPDTSDINSNSNPTESILLPLEQTPSELENVSSNFLQLQLSTDDEYHGNTNESPILQNDPEYSQLSQHQFNKPLSNQSSTSLHDTTIEPEQPLLPPVHVEPTEPEYSSALEHAADEVEDTLINIVSDYDSLLHDSRPSYPILRFCAGTALIDVSALDNLVSFFYTYTIFAL